MVRPHPFILLVVQGPGRIWWNEEIVAPWLGQPVLSTFHPGHGPIKNFYSISTDLSMGAGLRAWVWDNLGWVWWTHLRKLRPGLPTTW